MNESEILVNTIISAVQDKKGKRIVKSDLTSIGDTICSYLVVCEGNTPTQVSAIADAIEAAQAEIDKLQASGKLDQAKEALKSLQAWLTENAETVKSVVGDNAVVAGLLDKVSAINVDSIAVPAAVADAAETVEDVKAKAEEVQETVEDVKEAVEDVKAAAEDVKEAAKDAKDKVDAAKDLLKKK